MVPLKIQTERKMGAYCLTLAPFHFIPGKTISCIEEQEGSGNAYRCIPGKDAEIVLICQIDKTLVADRISLGRIFRARGIANVVLSPVSEP